MARPSQIAAYVAPFAVFIGFLAVNSIFPIPQWTRFVIEIALILALSRAPLSSKPVRPQQSLILGIAVSLLWVAPDTLIPVYRSLPLFSNGIVGHAVATTTNLQKHDPLFLLFRILNSVIAIPILEELFWRGFLLRWIINRDFRSVPPGTYDAGSFWIVALLFASEHGPYWDVGLLAGITYNWWMIRTRNLWDCIIAHAATNACLAGYVIWTGQWQFWL